MTHNISNELFSLSVQQQGVEISSLKSLKTGTEYIWNADPNVWASHAPVLFPIIGALKEGKCFIDNEAFAIPKHGIVRHNEGLSLISSTKDSLEFQLKASAESLNLYPYKFTFRIKYKLEGNKVIVSHLVNNTDEKDIYFALGAHPAFNCPFHSDDNYEDYYLEFNQVETASRWMLDENGLLSGEKIPYLKNTQRLDLHSDLFKDDALVFTDLKSKVVSLKSHKNDSSISISFYDFPYLGLWAKPNADFICIEPWQGLTDRADTKGDFKTKLGLIRLASGKDFQAQYEIQINEP